MRYSLYLVCLLVIQSVAAQNTGSLLLVNGTGTEVIAYEVGDPAIVRLVDADRNTDNLTAETVTVNITSAVESGGETITLTETGPATGIFSASVPLVEASTAVASDGQLQLERGKQITASYDDPADDFGNPKTVSDKAFFGVTLVSGPYSINTIWRKASSPYLVTGDVTVQSSTKLTIEPGVEVRFLPATDDQKGGDDANRSELIVFGEISALGTEADSIRFTSNADSPTTGDWYGIRLQDSNAKARFKYGVFAYGTYGLKMQNLYGTVLDTVAVEFSRFSKLGTGISDNNGFRYFRVEHNRFADIGAAMAFGYTGMQGAVSFRHNTVQHTSGSVIYVAYADRVWITNNVLDGSGGGRGIQSIGINQFTISDNTITANKDHGIIYNGNGLNSRVSVTGNTISGSQYSGLYLRQVADALVRRNTVTTNAHQGIWLDRTTARVDSNTVTGNLTDGVYITTDFNTPVTDSLLYNTITGNGGDGIENQAYGRPVLHYNNLHSNVGYDVNNRSDQHPEVNARFNWWGDNNTAIMSTGGNPKNLDKVYDSFDDAAVGFVNYGGYLGKAIDITKPPPPTPVAPVFTIAIRVADTGGHQLDLTLGTAEGATDALDPDLDLPAPPTPPSGTFDARIKGIADHFLTDIRGPESPEIGWTLGFQAAAGADPITLTWAPGSLPTDGSFRLQDVLGGTVVDVDMRSTGTYTPPSILSELRVVFSAVEELDVAMISGWNMVGMPVSATDMGYRTHFESSLERTLFRFSGMYTEPSSGTMEAGQGYWLRFPGAETVSVRGTSVRTVTRALALGWNMIAGPNCSVPSSSIQDPSSAILPGTLFGFSGAYQVATSVDAGRGYWIRASSAGTITLACSAGKGVAAPRLATDGLQELILTDQTGAEQRLYFGGPLGGANTEGAFTAPPGAPGQSFRALFDGGRYATDQTKPTVSLAGARFPVEILLTDTNQSRAAELVSADGTRLGSLSLLAGTASRIEDPRTAFIRITDDAAELPQEFVLEQNYPNPFNPVTTIRFGLPVETEVTLEVFDVLGRRVAVLLRNEPRGEGWHEISFDASHLVSGTYFYRLTAEAHSDIRQLTLIK